MGAPDSIDPAPDALMDLVGHLEQAAIAAGKQIMAARAAGAKITIKSDSTPVTQADRAAESLILARLAGLYPAVPVVAEELAEDGKCPGYAREAYFLVDALDGTRDFIAGRDEFTVNIALIRDFKPVAGVVYAPALGRLWSGAGDQAHRAKVNAGDEITDRKTIRTRKCPQTPVALISQCHREPETLAWLDSLPAHTTEHIGSSMKFCRIAEGLADVYPRMISLKQWDIAAGDAVLRAAGGVTLTPEGTSLSYCVENSDFRSGHFVGWGEAPGAFD